MDSLIGSGYDSGFGGAMGGYGMSMGSSMSYGGTAPNASPQRGYGNDRTEIEPTRVLPVTIAQIHNSEERSNFLYYDGVNLKHVAVVGLIIGFEVKTNWNIKIDDGTGVITVNVYPDSERINALRDRLNGGDWIRVIGRARKDEKRYTIFGLNVELIEDFNMVLYHHFHVVLAHERNESGMLPPNTDQGYGAVKSEMSSMNNMNPSNGMYGNSMRQGSMGQRSGGQNNIAVLTGRLMELLENTEALSIDEMQDSLHCDKDALMAVINDLRRTNKIYTANGYSFMLTGNI